MLPHLSRFSSPTSPRLTTLFWFTKSKNNCNTKIRRRWYQSSVREYLSRQYPSVYSQQECERFWADIWQRRGLFALENSEKEADFRLLLPPPNITGNLHLGHALTVSIQDALCRYHRMNGRTVKWYAGTDHAGIATQMVVEKWLFAKHGKRRHELSKEEFSKLFEEWKQTKVSEIESQLRSMGVSIDFTDQYFTLSPEMSSNVTDAFINLFNRGLIYRSSYMVNWSYYLQSTLSDIEVEHKHVHKRTNFRVPGCQSEFQLGVMHHFKYPVEGVDVDGTGHEPFATIATTRIESLMGDVALCVNPNDARHAHLIGKFALNPFTNERMPILADEAARPDFGTGVLKVTPAHSGIDYEIGQRHGLPSLDIFDDRGHIRCAYEPLNGVHRFEAKALVVEELAKRGLYCGSFDHTHSIPLCARSGDIIEQRLVPQWFLRLDDRTRYGTEFAVNRDNLSENSKRILEQIFKTEISPEDQNITMVPSSYRNTWKHWFSRHQDWCVSRQIFWGHRVPAYQIYQGSSPTDVWVAARSQSEALQLASEKHNLKGEDISAVQDSDVLDTWFSSGLLPLAVSGWFEKKNNNNPESLKKQSNSQEFEGKPHHPLSLMETGHDIIFFWVARMVLLSMALAGRLPFDRVLLHGMICDQSGQKMSKSKGNVVDPVHVITGASKEDLIAQHREALNSGLISKQRFTELEHNTSKGWPKGLPVCGADILRLSLLQSNIKEHQVSFDLIKAVKRRVLSNKMHQTIRFVLLHLNEDPDFKFTQPEPNQHLSIMDRWILARLAELVVVCEQAFAHSYDLHWAAKQMERFWVNDLCDVYLESIRPEVIDKVGDYQRKLSLLIHLTREALKVMHPIMPFITENLYQRLAFQLDPIGYQYRSILDEAYPKISEDELLSRSDATYLTDYGTVAAIVHRIRWFRQNFFIHTTPLIERVRIASANPGLSAFSDYIEGVVRNPSCSVEFINLYDLYRYDDEDTYCVQVTLDEDDNDGEEKNVSKTDDSDENKTKLEKSNETYEKWRRNALHSDEVYLLFTIKRDGLEGKLREHKLRLPEAKVQSLIDEFDQLHARRFNENYKKVIKIVS